MNLVLLKYFLERRKKLFNLNSKLLDNNTPLHVAVIFEPEGNFNPCLGVLLENGINLN
jgi:ankyrin repeat protein